MDADKKNMNDDRLSQLSRYHTSIHFLIQVYHGYARSTTFVLSEDIFWTFSK